MAEKSYRDAIRDAMIEEMDRDPNVLIMGEDIGVYEGTFRITAGMLKNTDRNASSTLRSPKREWRARRSGWRWSVCVRSSR